MHCSELDECSVVRVREDGEDEVGEGLRGRGRRSVAKGTDRLAKVGAVPDQGHRTSYKSLLRRPRKDLVCNNTFRFISGWRYLGSDAIDCNLPFLVLV
jgi:hypothetical protein